MSIQFLGFPGVMESYNQLRANGRKFVGFTYDISSRSRLHNGTRHPSIFLAGIGRRWNKSNWIVPLSFLGSIVELRESILAENREEYMTRESEADIVLYDSSIEESIEHRTFARYCEYIRSIHASLVNSIGNLSNEMAKKYDKFQEEFMGRDPHSKEYLDGQEAWEAYGRRTMKQAFKVAENRLQEVVRNAELWEDSGRLSDLILASRSAQNAEKEVINLRYDFIFRE